MPDYRIRWDCDVEADNPLKAARYALDTLRDLGSTATVFDVIDPRDGTVSRVDLLEAPIAGVLPLPLAVSHEHVWTVTGGWLGTEIAACPCGADRKIETSHSGPMFVRRVIVTEKDGGA